MRHLHQYWHVSGCYPGKVLGIYRKGNAVILAATGILGGFRIGSYVSFLLGMYILVYLSSMVEKNEYIKQQQFVGLHFRPFKTSWSRGRISVHHTEPSPLEVTKWREDLSWKTKWLPKHVLPREWVNDNSWYNSIPWLQKVPKKQSLKTETNPMIPSGLIIPRSWSCFPVSLVQGWSPFIPHLFGSWRGEPDRDVWRLCLAMCSRRSYNRKSTSVQTFAGWVYPLKKKQ